MTDVRDMIAGEVATRWLTEEVLSNRALAAEFVRYATQREPERWAKWAARRGKEPTDAELGPEAALIVSAMVIEALSAHLDALAAQVEVRRVLGEL